MRRTIHTTNKKHHFGPDMVLHATSSKGGVLLYGAIFKEQAGFTVVCQGAPNGNNPPQYIAHTYTWAKRLLWKHLKGGRW